MTENTTSLLRKAVEVRTDYFARAESNAFRLVNSAGDGLPGLTIDRLGEVLLVERHKKEAQAEALVGSLQEIFGRETPIYFKERWSKDPELLSGKQVGGVPRDGRVRVEENGLKFQLDLCRGEHIGLFLDGREVRAAVRGIAGGARVLNLFSYTGGFGVAAAAGGARSTTNVDNKKSALKGALANYRLNGLETNTRTFLRDDALRYLKRCSRGKGRYDLVILDPPPRFRIACGRMVDATDEYGKLVDECLGVLDDGGTLLLGLNTSDAGDGGFENIVRVKLENGGRIIRRIERLGPGTDFPHSGDRPVARFLLISV